MTWCHSSSRERPSAKSDVKNSKGVNNTNNNNDNKLGIIVIISKFY